MRETDPKPSTALRAATPVRRARKAWVAPRVEDLPLLTDLTLSTGGGIPGSGNPNGGSTVF